MLRASPSYSECARRRTHRPPRQTFYPRFRACLRLDFEYTCAYCLSAEKEVSPLDAYGGFEIEHFAPKSKFPRQSKFYGNLLWACRACNRAKASQWPKKAQRSRGQRFVNPSQEGIGLHLDVRAKDGSVAGEYMIQRVGLNSALHRKRREERKHREQVVAQIEATIEMLQVRARSKSDTGALETLLSARRLLQEMDRQGRPWDAPNGCLCSLH